ncbi:gamma-glutamyltransferase [Sphingomicrobium flavum]|uniref:gamma-glutamyltransferase n=1 Tax=Sphingomicrobium flavum TaxID=1229164 RepID=UPI0021ADEE17|nr:gamma-glutamyltransferase [Sphingomicrobium flavum]
MMTRFLPFAALLLASCVTAPQPTSSFSTGAVSSAEPRATAAGEEILAKGGSATDAALAVLVALSVVEPQSSGIGGGGFLVRSDANGNVTTYDGREMAPSAAGPNWFLGPDGQPMGFRSVVPGGRSVGVPGNIALMKLAHDKHGKLAWHELFQPAIRLARGGFPMTRRLRNTLESRKDVAALLTSGRDIYYDASGEPLAEGAMIRNPAKADMLERIAALGPEAFYSGQNAEAIATTVNYTKTAPAPLTAEDVGRYVAKERAPVCGGYRGYKICSMGPPSSGATTVLQIVKLLEPFDMKGMGKDDPRSWHLIAEASRLAYADRGQYLGDGDFVSVPVAGLVDDAYLRERAARIRLDSVMGDVTHGTPPGALAIMASGMEPDENGTSHFAVADGAGNVVSLTSTIESAFGSGLIVNGYYLNNELTDFSFRPTGDDGRPVANAVAAGKRPRSSMSPAIVFDPKGRPVLAVGAAGGSTIITQTAKNIIAFIDWDLSAQQAIDLRNIYSPGNTIQLEEGDGSEALATALRAMGHQVDVIRPRFKANAVEKVNGRWVAATDPRTQKDVSP